MKLHLFGIFLFFLSSNTVWAKDRIIVFAAASLQTALDEISAAWAAENQIEVLISYGSSATLARQIQAGAPADIFFSATVSWMDELEEERMLLSETRQNLLGNKLVLIRHGDGPNLGQLTPELDISNLLGAGRLAIGLIDAVPAGIYGREALTNLGLWNAVSPNLAEAENVRAALMLVATGATQLGIVYQTDARIEPNVSILGYFPQNSHSPIIYPVAATTSAAQPEALAFLDFLGSDKGQEVFEAEGFIWRPTP